jgi:RNA ligase (TIGR02306 family)
MSTFAVNIVEIEAVDPIENADAIEVVRIGGYRCVVKKGDYKVGDVAAYIPEDTLVPLRILRELGLEGRLVGPEKNRVKAIKLRGVLSQGILYPVTRGEHGITMSYPWSGDEERRQTLFDLHVGDDVSLALGCIKYHPPIPTNMAGDVIAVGARHTLKFDIENIKKYPSVLVEGEPVYVTEKLHGTFCAIGVVPPSEESPSYINRRNVVFSKGLGGDGLVFCESESNHKKNLYVRTADELDLYGVAQRAADLLTGNIEPVFILGEIFGKGVQDLEYGLQKPEFRLFSVVYGHDKKYVNAEDLEQFAADIGVTCVPFIAKGVPFSPQLVEQLTGGKTTIDGAGIREGVVFVPAIERRDPLIGRVVLKSVSETYLMRKSKNATEYQ